MRKYILRTLQGCFLTETYARTKKEAENIFFKTYEGTYIIEYEGVTNGTIVKKSKITNLLI